MIILNTITKYEIISSKSKTYKEFFRFNNELYRKKELKLFERNSKIVDLINRYEKDFVNLFLSSLGFNFKDSENVGMIRFIDNEYKLVNYENKEMPKKKKKMLLQNMIGHQFFNTMIEKSLCEREKVLHSHSYYMKTISLFKEYLVEGGSVFFAFFNQCVNNYTIETVIYLSTMFQKVVVINANYVYCFQFLGGNRDISLPMSFTVLFREREKLYRKLVRDMVRFQSQQERAYEYIVNNRYDEYIDTMIDSHKELIINYLDPQKYFDLQLITLKRIFFDKNSFSRISSNINMREAQCLVNILLKYSCKSCLEVGMAFGISSYYILNTSKKISLISIDPYQSSQWKNYGRKLLKYHSMSNRHKLIQKKSYEALPSLLKKYKNKLDFIFIDGFHTFDYTLVDFFYSCRLLKLGGVIVVDDVLHRGVSQAISYIDSNYRAFLKPVDSYNSRTMRFYEKISEDNRAWDFHIRF